MALAIVPPFQLRPRKAANGVPARVHFRVTPADGPFSHGWLTLDAARDLMTALSDAINHAQGGPWRRPVEKEPELSPAVDGLREEWAEVEEFERTRRAPKKCAAGIPEATAKQRHVGAAHWREKHPSSGLPPEIDGDEAAYRAGRGEK